MSATASCPEPLLKAGSQLQGFRVLRVEAIPEIRITAYEMEHIRTGAKVIHLHCDDKENLYSIGFRTPPFDSTGVPHILEHSVLAGSENYPLKDVFNELLKGTLQTFINAFTYPDKTVYPVASQTKTDFFNLARVYTDLVLKPRLLRETFFQEGHHLEFADADNTASDLTISGIVYNEMKGAYSSPDSLMYKSIQENLYPETTYACDSGGDPDIIPDLTHEQLKDFHRLYYSPSNARFILYGDIPTTDHLVFLADVLAGFERVGINSFIKSQTRWQNPAVVRGRFPIGRDEDVRRKSIVNIAWMTVDNTEYEEATLLGITSGLLVGSAAGPLRKALIDSGLGEDLSPVTGLERDVKQIVFAVGLRGVETEAAPQVETLIMKTLEDIAGKGFDSDLIEGTLHRVEFQGKEIVRKTMPYGISLMGRIYHTWLYDGDPLAGLNFPKIIESIRSKWRQNPGLFQDIVRRWFLDNPHRLLSIMEPSKTIQQEREEAFRKKMADRKAALSADDLETIRRQASALKAYQSDPDPPEASAKLPKLRVADLPRDIDIVPTEERRVGGAPVLVHDLFTNGIAYLDLVFDISDVPEDMQGLLPLLGKMTLNLGAGGIGYEEMAKRLAMKTGGVAFHLSCGRMFEGSGVWQKMVISVKALYRNTQDAVTIVSDLLTKGDFSEDARMRDLIMEKRNRLQAAVVPSGHMFAKMAAAAAVSVPGLRDEQWHGRTQLREIAKIAGTVDKGMPDLSQNLLHLRDLIFRRNRLSINMTADSEGISILSEAADRLLSSLAPGKSGHAGRPGIVPVNAGIEIPADVSYVAQVMPAPTYREALSPHLLVLAKYLSSDYLYKRVRVQGGAYGGMSQYDPLNGTFSFLSYRDPHIAGTFRVYEEAEEFLKKMKGNEEEIEKAVIGTIGGLDRPMDPSSRGYTAMIRHIAGLTDSFRQQFRDRILETTASGIHSAASAYFAAANRDAETARAAFASGENLKRANEAMDRKLLLEQLLSTDA